MDICFSHLEVNELSIPYPEVSNDTHHFGHRVKANIQVFLKSTCLLRVNRPLF